MFKNKILYIFLAVFILYLLFLILYSPQKLLEQHSFRQTQTALTSYWILQNNFKFNYETPVVGYPWRIPFEFPLYQYLVSIFVKFTGISLDQSGRLLSGLFFILSTIPIFQIFREIKLKKEFIYVFLCLLFSSPLYMFWSRTFMIESAALFFALMSTYYAICFFFSKISFKNILLFIFFSSIAILQKSTTALPILFCLYILTLYSFFSNPIGLKYNFKRIILISLIYIIPFLVGMLWISYTDIVKSNNTYGVTLTSRSLYKWNIGFLNQRISTDFFRMIWNRLFSQELAGFFGVGFIFVFLKNTQVKNIKILFFFALLFIFPLLIFTPLHLVHSYYQYSCAIFLIAILAYSIAYFDYDKYKIKQYGIVFFTLFFVLFNYINSFSFYFKKARRQITEYSNTNLGVAYSILRHTNEGSAVVVYGKDWGSEIPYYSQRKSFVVPSSFSGFNKVWLHPEFYMGNLPISAFVFFLNEKKIKIIDVLSFPSRAGYNLFCLESNIYMYVFNKKQISYRGRILHSIN